MHDVNHQFQRPIPSSIASRISKCPPFCLIAQRFEMSGHRPGLRPRRGKRRTERDQSDPSEPMSSIQDEAALATLRSLPSPMSSVPAAEPDGMRSPWHGRCLFHRQFCGAAGCHGVRGSTRFVSLTIDRRPCGVGSVRPVGKKRRSGLVPPSADRVGRIGVAREGEPTPW